MSKLGFVTYSKRKGVFFSDRKSQYRSVFPNLLRNHIFIMVMWRKCSYPKSLKFASYAQSIRGVTFYGYLMAFGVQSSVSKLNHHTFRNCVTWSVTHILVFRSVIFNYYLVFIYYSSLLSGIFLSRSFSCHYFSLIFF
jgi:hypothetical protein